MMKTIKLSAILLFAAVLLASCGEVISGPSGEGTYMLTVETKRPDRPLTKSLDITTNGDGSLQPVRVYLPARPVKK